MTKTIDEWAAEVCSVKLSYVKGMLYKWTFNNVEVYVLWTIKDPRCREIVREHYKIGTWYSVNEWVSQCAFTSSSNHTAFTSYGKNIEQSEIACITAIYEAENGSEE